MRIGIWGSNSWYRNYVVPNLQQGTKANRKRYRRAGLTMFVSTSSILPTQWSFASAIERVRKVRRDLRKLGIKSWPAASAWGHGENYPNYWLSRDGWIAKLIHLIALAKPGKRIVIDFEPYFPPPVPRQRYPNLGSVEARQMVEAALPFLCGLARRKALVLPGFDRYAIITALVTMSKRVSCADEHTYKASTGEFSRLERELAHWKSLGFAKRYWPGFFAAGLRSPVFQSDIEAIGVRNHWYFFREADGTDDHRLFGTPEWWEAKQEESTDGNGTDIDEP